MLRRLATSTAALLALSGFAVDATGAGRDAGQRLGPAAFIEAVRGQAIELRADAPADTPAVTFWLAGTMEEDRTYPFEATFDTDELEPRDYGFRSSRVDGAGTVTSLAPQGSVTIHPLPQLRDFRVSALIVSGTQRVVGIVVSNVERNRVVRAWAFDERELGNMRRLGLRLQRARGSTRVYRLSDGNLLHAEKNGMIEIEVATQRPAFAHGVEVRGRSALLWLRRNDATGQVLAHQTERSGCTTWRYRERNKSDDARRVSCVLAPTAPAVQAPVQHLP